MSVRHAILALLEEGPRYGYQLRAQFEQRTGSTWPLNVGQVYTTLTRLERDGLVDVDGTDAEGHVIYRITDGGRAEVADWFGTPLPRTRPERDELAIKLALAVTVPGVDVAAVVQRQRAATTEALQDFTRLKRQVSEESRADLAWSLVLESLVFDAEAEIRWLDHCEARLLRAEHQRSTAAGAQTASPADGTAAAEVPRSVPPRA